jgi:hypothetical protein
VTADLMSSSTSKPAMWLFLRPVITGVCVCLVYLPVSEVFHRFNGLSEPILTFYAQKKGKLRRNSEFGTIVGLVTSGGLRLAYVFSIFVSQALGNRVLFCHSAGYQSSRQTSGTLVRYALSMAIYHSARVQSSLPS